MSSSVYVITNSLSHGNRTIVYETETGSVVFDGNHITAKELYNILSEINGLAQYVGFRELTDAQMKDWKEEIYK